MQGVTRPHGLVLAGGQARRMGGGDKPLLALGGAAMLDHVVARIGPQVSRLAISANGDAARFARFCLPVVADAVAGLGPLSGILAGLRWAAGEGADWLLVVPGDTPFLPGDLAARLATAVRSGGVIAHAVSDGRDHPCVALISVALAEGLDGALRRGVRSLTDWQGVHAPARVEYGTDGGDPLLNVNTPADLAAAEGVITAMNWAEPLARP